MLKKNLLAVAAAVVCFGAFGCQKEKISTDNSDADTAAIREKSKGPIEGAILRVANIAEGSLLRSRVSRTQDGKHITCWYRNVNGKTNPLTTVWIETADFEDFYSKTPLGENLPFKNIVNASATKNVVMELGVRDFEAVVLKITAYNEIMIQDGFDAKAKCPANPDAALVLPKTVSRPARKPATVRR